MCFALGNWWVHRTSQRKRLWDHGEFWKARIEFGSNCCSDSSCKGNLSLMLIAFVLDTLTEQCGGTRICHSWIKKWIPQMCWKPGTQCKGCSTVVLILSKMACSYFFNDGDQITVIQKIACNFLCRLLVKMTIVSFLSLLCFLVDKLFKGFLASFCCFSPINLR